MTYGDWYECQSVLFFIIEFILLIHHPQKQKYSHLNLTLSFLCMKLIEASNLENSLDFPEKQKTVRH
jgi:hypothetical protein